MSGPIAPEKGVDFFLMAAGGLLISRVGSPVAPCAMQTERILVPVDLERCHPEVFSCVNLFAGNGKVTVVLLHVLNRNPLASHSWVDAKLSQEAHWKLEQLARQFLHPDIATILRVRVGKPVEEILAETEAQAVDLIILPLSSRACREGRLWVTNRHAWGWFTGVSQKVIRLAPCPVLVLRAKTPFNCGHLTAAQAMDVRSALQYLEVISGGDTPSDLEPEDPFAQSERSRQLAA